MKTIRELLGTVSLTLVLSLGAHAQQFFFANTTMYEEQSSVGYYLYAPSADLTRVTGIPGLDCGTADTCVGRVSLQTGSTDGFNQNLINNIGGGGPTNFGPGGSLTITELVPGSDGKIMTVFNGTFSDDTWTFVGNVSAGDYQWILTFSMDGTLYLPDGEQRRFDGVVGQMTTASTKGTDPFQYPGGKVVLLGGELALP
jgi:hypothetical protein